MPLLIMYEKEDVNVCVRSFFAFLERIRAAVGASSKQPKKCLPSSLSLLSGTFYFYFLLLLPLFFGYR